MVVDTFARAGRRFTLKVLADWREADHNFLADCVPFCRPSQGNHR